MSGSKLILITPRSMDSGWNWLKLICPSLPKRIGEVDALKEEVSFWHSNSNYKQKGIGWPFTIG